MPSLNSTSFKVLQMIVVLQERHHLNQSAIPVLNEFILDILSSFATELELQTVTELGEEVGEALKCVATRVIMNHPIHSLNSEHQVLQHLTHFCGFVTPKEVILGEEHEENAAPGCEDVTTKNVKEQIIPFKDSLSQMFKNKEIRQLLETPHELNSVQGKICSARDGAQWKSDPFFQRHPNALVIQIYFDDLEVTNALGSRTGVHKVTNFYYSLLNIPEHLRSNLKAICLIASVKSSNIKKFGYLKVLEDFVSCISKLESENGMVLDLSEGEKIQVFGKLHSVNGDGLALNHIGGFKGISGARHPCRNCSISNLDMKKCFVEKGLRDKQNHEAQLKQISDPSLHIGEKKELEKSYGVVGPSVLSQIPSFDVTKQLLQDKMHNLLEGVADVCIRELISYLITAENSILTLETLNSKLATFQYPDELIKNRPSPISNNHLSAHLRQKAAQMICLLCVLPFILAPFENDLNKEHLLNLSLLLQITHRLLAYNLNSSSVSTLKLMILTHHKRFCILYPNASVTPKFHFLVHAPTTIENFGPCRVSWCMRYEGMNAWFAQAAGQTNNFINITKSLTWRFQVKRCIDFGMGDKDHVVLGEKTFSPVISSKTCLKDYKMGSLVAKSIGVDINSTVEAASTIFVRNFELNQNTILMLSDNPDVGLPVFGQIKAIFVKENIATVVINRLETMQFDILRCSYEVQLSDVFSCMRVDHIVNVQPFPIVKTNIGQFVLPLYYDARVFTG